MESNNRNIEAETDFITRPTRLDQQFNQIKIIDKEEKRKNFHFAFLIPIFIGAASDHLAHLQSHVKQPKAQALQHSQILFSRNLINFVPNFTS